MLLSSICREGVRLYEHRKHLPRDLDAARRSCQGLQHCQRQKSQPRPSLPRWACPRVTDQYIETFLQANRSIRHPSLYPAVHVPFIYRQPWRTQSLLVHNCHSFSPTPGSDVKKVEVHINALIIPDYSWASVFAMLEIPVHCGRADTIVVVLRPASRKLLWILPSFAFGPRSIYS